MLPSTGAPDWWDCPRMSSPRCVAGFIPWEHVDLKLLALRTIWLSTTRPDGRPHVTPVWFTWTGNIVHFSTDERSQKARNLAQSPSVLLHTGDGDEVVIIEGKAQLVTDEAERTAVDAKRGHKYIEPKSGQRDTILVAGTLLYRVPAERVTTWTYGNVATRTEWRFEP